jgi:pimeloyl-ACP methyl ester carboxylesterase
MSNPAHWTQRRHDPALTVLCLHASASSSRQWELLASDLDPHFRILGPDLYGHGIANAWSGEAAFTLDHEVARIEPLLGRDPGGIHIVAHSYGAMVALALAYKRPDRVRSLVLFEPVSLQLLTEYNARDLAARELDILARSVAQRVGAGALAEAAQRFVDYWSGEGAWQRLDTIKQQSIAKRMITINRQFGAVRKHTPRLRDLASIDMPVLLVSGAQSRASTRRIAELLTDAIPGAMHHRLHAVAHMGPITHADTFNPLVAVFLGMQARQRDRLGERAAA